MTFLSSLLDCPTCSGEGQFCALSPARSSGTWSFLLPHFVLFSLACCLLPATLLLVDVARGFTPQKAGGSVSGHLHEFPGCDARHGSRLEIGLSNIQTLWWEWRQPERQQTGKSLLYTVSASRPSGIKLRCSLNPAFPLFWLRSACLFSGWRAFCVSEHAEKWEG